MRIVERKQASDDGVVGGGQEARTSTGALSIAGVPQALALVGARLAAGALTAITTLTIARSLTEAAYGTLAVVLALVGLLVLIADFGLTSSLARYIAENRLGRRPFLSILLVRFGAALAAGVALALYGIAVQRNWVAGGRGSVDLPLLTFIGAGLVVTHSAVGVFQGLFSPISRVGWLLTITITYPLLELVGVVAATRLDTGALGVLAASVLAGAITASIGLPVLLDFRPTPAPSVPANELVRYALPLFVVWACVAAFGVIDQIVINYFHGARAVAPYALCWKLVAMLQLPALAIGTMVAPRLVQSPRRAQQYRSWLSMVILGYVAICGIAGVLAPAVFDVIGPPYRDAHPLLLALLGYVLVAGVAPFVSLVSNYLGGAHHRIRIAAGTLGLNVVLDLLLVPRLGSYGAAAATTICGGCYLAFHLRLNNSLLDERGSLHRAYEHLPRVVLALGASVSVAVVVKHAFEGSPWVQLWIAGLVCLSIYTVFVRTAAVRLWQGGGGDLGLNESRIAEPIP